MEYNQIGNDSHSCTEYDAESSRPAGVAGKKRNL